MTVETVFLFLTAFLLGATSGSFANVAIWRWPQNKGTSEPKRSICPTCDKPIPGRYNIPIVSWLMLKGTSKCCDTPISPRYVAVETAMAVLFVAVAWVWQHDVTFLPVMFVVTWSLYVASHIDLQHFIIPNRLTYRLPFILAVLLVGHAWHNDLLGSLWGAGLYGLLLPVALLFIAELFRFLRGKQGIGMGDIKVLMPVGMVLGYLSGWHVLAFVYATLISATIIVVVLMLAKKKTLASKIPFGPYISVGTFVVLMFPRGSVELLLNTLGL